MFIDFVFSLLRGLLAVYLSATPSHPAPSDPVDPGLSYSYALTVSYEDPEPVFTAASAGAVSDIPGQIQLSEEQIRSVLVQVGTPAEWIEPFIKIGWCESRFSPEAIGDNGNSFGWLQLWNGWFPAAGFLPGQYKDPFVTARVGLFVRETRGRFGGAGGWADKCSIELGIY
jgi:hypothetical protein